MYPFIVGMLAIVADCPSPKAIEREQARLVYPTLDKMAAEARAMQRQHPARWANYQAKTAHVFADNEKQRAHWSSHLPPPSPDLAPRDLPLPFLVAELRATKGPGTRQRAYLMAIVRSRDERRMKVLIEYRDLFQRRWPRQAGAFAWGKLVAETATLPWAVEQIWKLTVEKPAFHLATRSDNLLFCLIDRFAGQLSGETEKAAYAYVREPAGDGPSGFDRTQLWHVLFGLDRQRASSEVLGYFHQPSGRRYGYNFSVISLLAAHPGLSKEVAASVRGWLATQKDLLEFNRRQLRVVLLRAAPAQELAPTVRYIDRLLAEQKSKHARFEPGGDAHYLLLALSEIHTRPADEQMARYVFEPAVDSGVRLLLLEALVRHHWPKSAELVARWLTEEPAHMRVYLKKQASRNWGPYGREVLKEAEHMNAKKGG